MSYLKELEDHVKVTRTLIETHRHSITPQDLLIAYMCLDSMRFHIRCGDVRRARAEMRQSMCFVKALIPMRDYSGINHASHKRYVEDWAFDHKEQIEYGFPGHSIHFQYGMGRKHWNAFLRIIQNQKVHYLLRVEILFDGGEFVVRSDNKIGRRRLYKQIEIDPPCCWLHSALNAAYDAIYSDFSIQNRSVANEENSIDV